MDVTYRCVLEFKMPEERHNLTSAINGERYYHALIEMGELLREKMEESPGTDMLELWDDCRGIAHKAGVTLF